MEALVEWIEGEPGEVLAVVVSFVSLAVAAWSAHHTHKHNRLAILPVLHINEQFSPMANFIGIVIFNRGLGTAVADGFQLAFKGTSLSGSPREQWEWFKSHAGLEEVPTNVGWCKPGEIWRAQDGPVEILLVLDSTKVPQDHARRQELAETLREAIDDLTITIPFHSLHGERFVLTWCGSGPQHLQQLR